MKTIFSPYTGQYVAMINKKIISSGRTTLEAYRKAKGLHLEGTISFMYIPTKRETITFL